VLPGTSHLTIVDRAELLLAIIPPFLEAPMPKARSLRRTLRGALREPRSWFLLCATRADDEYELVTVVLTEPEEGWSEMRFRRRGPMTLEDHERARVVVLLRAHGETP
jgi:hypothetical protein